MCAESFMCLLCGLMELKKTPLKNPDGSSVEILHKESLRGWTNKRNHSHMRLFQDVSSLCANVQK